MPAEWKATAFTSDSKADYSVSYQGERVEVRHNRASGTVGIEVTDKLRRTYIVIPARLLTLKNLTVIEEAPKSPTAELFGDDDDGFDFG